MSTHYVYAHSAKGLGVFYVGKGSGDRLYVTGNRNARWKALASIDGYTASILQTCESEDDAYQAESDWIAYFKGVGQCGANVSLGGRGVTVANRWWGNKISESLRGMSRPKGVESASYKAVSPDELRLAYTNTARSIDSVADQFGLSITGVYNKLVEFGIPLRPTSRKAIICTTTGQSYQSIAEAAKSTGLFRENIRKVLAGKYKTTGGLKFEYEERE